MASKGLALRSSWSRSSRKGARGMKAGRIAGSEAFSLRAASASSSRASFRSSAQAARTPELDRRDMGFDKLFLIATRLELMKGPIANIEQIHDRMRQIGAHVEPVHAGEPQP